MSLFNDIPDRTNGEIITESFFGSIKAKLLIAFGDAIDANTLWAAVTTTLGTVPAPRMNETQRDAIVVDAGSEGLMVWNTTSSSLNVYNGSAWVSVDAAAADVATHAALTSTHGVTEILGKDEAAVMTNKSTSDDFTVGGNLTVSGTTTSINTATLEIEDANVTVNKNGNDVTAEGAGLTIERASSDGTLFYDQNLPSKFEIGNVGNTSEVATVGNTQTLTNKTMTSPVLNSADINDPIINVQTLEEQSSTPVQPAPGSMKLYAKDDKTIYQLDSNGTESLIAGGGGSQPLNVFHQDDMEDIGSTTSGMTYGSDVSFLTNSGAFGGTVGAETTLPIASVSSLKWTGGPSPGSNLNDWFAFAPITLNERQIGNTIEVSFWYKWNGADTTVRFKVWATNSTDYQLLETDFLKATTTTVPVQVKALINIPSDCTEITYGFHYGNGVSTFAKELIVDDLVFNDDSLSTASLVEESTVFSGQKVTAQNSLTGANTITYNTANIDTHSSYSAGVYTVPSAGKYKIYGSLQFESVVSGEWALLSIVAGGSSIATVLKYATQTSKMVSVSGLTELNTGDTILIQANQQGTYNAAAGDRAVFTIDKITEPADHVIRSGESTDSLVFYAAGNTNDVLGAGAVVPFIEVDDLGNNYSANSFTFPRDGVYTINGSVRQNSVNNNIRIRIGGSLLKNFTTGQATFQEAFDYTGHFNEGEVLTITTSSAITLVNSTAEHWLSITSTEQAAQTLYALPQSEQQDYHASFTSAGVLEAPYNVSGITATWGTSRWDIDYSVLGLTSIPEINAIPTNNAGRNITVYQATPTGCSIYLYDSDITDSYRQEPFTIRITKSGADASSGQVYVGNVARHQTMFVIPNSTGYYANQVASASWKVGNLDSLKGDVIGSISLDRLLLPSGSYEIEVPVGSNGGALWLHFRLYNHTDSSEDWKELYTCYSENANTTLSSASLKMSITITEPKEFEFHTTATGAAGNEYIGPIKVTKIR